MLSSKYFSIEVVIVDDDSNDGIIGTVQNYVQNSNNQFFQVKLHQRKNKKGLSSAILDGVELTSNEYIIVMDADLSHPPEIIKKMITLLQDRYHLVIGSRYVEGGTVENWSIKRRIISKGATLIAKIGLNINQKDPMSGFFGFHKNILSGINFDAIGYKILLEILVKNKNIKIKEIPISFNDRDYGKSKLGIHTIIDFIISVWKLYRYGKKTLCFLT